MVIITDVNSIVGHGQQQHNNQEHKNNTNTQIFNTINNTAMTIKCNSIYHNQIRYHSDMLYAIRIVIGTAVSVLISGMWLLRQGRVHVGQAHAPIWKSPLQVGRDNRACSLGRRVCGGGCFGQTHGAPTAQWRTTRMGKMWWHNCTSKPLSAVF